MPNLSNIKSRQHNTLPEGRDAVTDPFYTSRKWRKVRQIKLQHNPLCEVCKWPKQATVIDHHIPRRFKPDLSLDIDNLTSMCDRHHAQKSALEGRASNLIEWKALIDKSKFKK